MVSPQFLQTNARVAPVIRPLLLPYIFLLNSLLTDYPLILPYLTVAIENILKYTASETGKLCS